MPSDASRVVLSYLKESSADNACGCVLKKLREFLKNTEKDWNYILPKELKEQMGKKDFFILDIRKPKDFAEGHIPGAKNIYWLDLLDEENLEKLPKNKKIILICYLGHTSSQATVLLKLLGYDVASVKFGYGEPPVKRIQVAGWKDLGFEMEKGKV
jgi:rhodanese-related sulfurtransferase